MQEGQDTHTQRRRCEARAKRKAPASEGGRYTERDGHGVPCPYKARRQEILRTDGTRRRASESGINSAVGWWKPRERDCSRWPGREQKKGGRGNCRRTKSLRDAKKHGSQRNTFRSWLAAGSIFEGPFGRWRRKRRYGLRRSGNARRLFPWSVRQRAKGTARPDHWLEVTNR